MAPTETDAGRPDVSVHTTLARAWWREWEVALLAALVLLIYGSRLTTLPFRGEETRRARIAIEMMESGDWIVPRQQGQPLLSRPPLQNWVIALVGLVRGEVDEVATRLPSVLAVLLTAILIYGYSRTFLSRLGSFAAAAAFATLGQVLELGRLGETEAPFTLLVSGPLLLWHWGRVRGWPAAWTWSAAYLLVAFGMLAKGIQAPAYFAASVGAFLLLRRRWRDALAWPHLVGILVFLSVWGTWQVLFYSQLGWQGVRGIYGGDVALRFEDTRWLTILKHLGTYPIEMLLGCLLPWSVLLLAYLNRGFRGSIGPAKEHVIFLSTSLLVTFPTCWLVPGANTRYFMPLYPCFAPLIGLVVQRCCEAQRSAGWRLLWTRFLAVMAVVMFLSGGVILAGSCLAGGPSPIGQPLGFALFFAAAAVGLGWATLRSRRALSAPDAGVTTVRAGVTGILGVALFAGLLYSGAVLNDMLRRSEVRTADAVAEVKRQLPPGVRLVSIEPNDHLFAYYYRDPIPQVALSDAAEAMDPETTYFCFSSLELSPKDLPFPFETVATVSCERWHMANPSRTVTVVRRLPDTSSAAQRGGDAPRR